MDTLDEKAVSEALGRYEDWKILKMLPEVSGSLAKLKTLYTKTSEGSSARWQIDRVAYELVCQRLRESADDFSSEIRWIRNNCPSSPSRTHRLIHRVNTMTTLHKIRATDDLQVLGWIINCNSRDLSAGIIRIAKEKMDRLIIARLPSASTVEEVYRLHIIAIGAKDEVAKKLDELIRRELPKADTVKALKGLLEFAPLGSDVYHLVLSRLNEAVLEAIATSTTPKDVDYLMSEIPADVRGNLSGDFRWRREELYRQQLSDTTNFVELTCMFHIVADPSTRDQIGQRMVELCETVEQARAVYFLVRSPVALAKLSELLETAGFPPTTC